MAASTLVFIVLCLAVAGANVAPSAPAWGQNARSDEWCADSIGAMATFAVRLGRRAHEEAVSTRALTIGSGTHKSSRSTHPRTTYDPPRTHPSYH